MIYDLSNTFHLRPQKKKISYIKIHNVDNAWINLFKIRYKSGFFLTPFITVTI